MFSILASTPTIDIDTTTLFDSINDWIPLFMGLLAIVGGIRIGRAIVMWIIDAVTDAFK
jgi:hypothetical protein